MKRETAIIYSCLTLLMISGFYLGDVARAEGSGSVVNKQVIQMDNGDKICLILEEGSDCPIAYGWSITTNDCALIPLLSADISRVLTATPLDGDDAISVNYAGVPEQACPKIVLRAADTSLGATWVCVGGRCFYK
jgi:hypothetical protein